MSKNNYLKRRNQILKVNVHLKAKSIIKKQKRRRRKPRLYIPRKKKDWQNRKKNDESNPIKKDFIFISKSKYLRKRNHKELEEDSSRVQQKFLEMGKKAMTNIKPKKGRKEKEKEVKENPNTIDMNLKRKKKSNWRRRRKWNAKRIWR